MRCLQARYSLFQNTPTVKVVDNRGRSIRDISYHRHPDTPALTEGRITRHQFNALGQLAQSTDPRLFALQQADSMVSPNFTYLSSLTGDVLRTDSVDAGTTVALKDIARRPVLSINATGVTRTWQYEEKTLPGRPLSISEQAKGDSARVTERFVWAANSQAEKDCNLAGQCVRQYDTAGLGQTTNVALTGSSLSVGRQLLKEDQEPDWQGSDEFVWQDLLDSERFTTQSTADVTGALLTQIDAKDNLRRLAYDVAGLLRGSWLTLKGGAEQIILKSRTYSAAGQKLREDQGNGMITTYTYEPETQRLIRIKTERQAGHAAGVRILQDLHYQYDPVGNVTHIRNDAEVARFWRNQKIVPENAYVYDSLYQLIEANGREMANNAQQNSVLPAPVRHRPSDNTIYTNYIRRYNYDRAGNLTQIRHLAPATQNNYTTDITISDRSNRAVLSSLTAVPEKVDAFFDRGGHQQQLHPGQTLSWNSRGELQQATPVMQEEGGADNEHYRYGSDGMRISKVRVQQNADNTQTQRIIYLPGVEWRTAVNRAGAKETLHVITVGEAGFAQVRVLHWESGKPEAIHNDQPRYSYDNLIGSSGLETDGEGRVISQEEYYPYGGTAVWMARNQTEADYKTYRYSGKERDITGLYYYGYRYYQPWAGRWLSADPAGTIDGLNLFRMARDNPATLKDSDGRTPILEAYRDSVVKLYNKNIQPTNEITENDFLHLPALIASENIRNPRLNLSFQSSPENFLEEIQREDWQGNRRFIVGTGMSDMLHFVAIDALRSSQGHLSVIGYESALIGEAILPEWTAREITEGVNKIPNAKAIFLETNIQTSPHDCAIYSLSFASKMEKNSREINKFHQKNSTEVFSELEDGIYIPKAVVDIYLQPDFFKHVASSNRLNNYIHENEEAKIGIINKKGETLTLRRERLIARRDEKIYSKSIEIKRIEFINRALAIKNNCLN